MKVMGGGHGADDTRLSVGCGWVDIGGAQLLEQAEVSVLWVRQARQ